MNIAPYVRITSHDKFGNDAKIDGVGDLFFRAKYIAYTSPDSKFAVALVPYIKAPTAKIGIGNGEVEGGGGRGPVLQA